MRNTALSGAVKGMSSTVLSRCTMRRHLSRSTSCSAASCATRRRREPERRWIPVANAAAGRDASAPLPQIWSEVVGWAKREFDREVCFPKADAQINLGRACLLIALEEEAAIEMHPEMESHFRGMPIKVRSMASASTWSLERLDSLAAEVKAVFLRGIAEEEDTQQQKQQQQQEQQQQQPTSLPSHSPPLASGSDGSGLEPEEALQPEERSQEEGGRGSADAASWNPALVQQRTTQLLQAVNSVLFERHGYAACNRYGVPRDAQLSSVMESGVGCSAALSILYLEVCSRLGLQMEAKPLEQGRYFILWPKAQPIVAGGQQFVVDPYGCGGLLLASEVCEMFDVEISALWRPATRRQLLAALLGDLRDSYWARALRCSPNPSTMTPLSLSTALENKVGGVNVHGLRRALAAAGKRLGLLPHDRDAQLEFALLQYFSNNYDDAWIELGILLEKQQQHSQDTATQRANLQQRCTASTPPAPSVSEAASSQAAPLPGRCIAGPASPSLHEDAAPSTLPAAEAPASPCSDTSVSAAEVSLGALSPPEGLPPASTLLSSSASAPAAGVEPGCSSDQQPSGSSSSGDDACWLPLDEQQLQQVGILLEKVRLQLSYSRTR